MPGLRVRFVGADSMGVRGFAVVVEACGYVVGVDLGASIAPRRYGLPPHELELRRLEETLDRVRAWIGESHIVTVTHYHYDHYVRGEPGLYKGKILLVKHPRLDINASQRARSYRFLKELGDGPARVEYADSRAFEFEGGLRLEFSRPVWHGEPGTRVGKVLMVRVECDGESFVYTSDVQGPADPDALEVLLSWPRPRVMALGGPPTYFAGFKVPVEAVEEGLRGMMEVVTRVRPRVLVYDHHILRDARYLDRVSSHLAAAQSAGVRMETAAEYMGLPVEQLEARRRELWGAGGGGVEAEGSPP